MTEVELKSYVKDHYNSIIAQSAHYLKEEDGLWFYYGKIACVVHYDDWDDNGNLYYRVTAHNLNDDGIEDFSETGCWTLVCSISIG